MSENFLSFISNVGGKPADASVPENANPSEKTTQGAEFNSILEKEQAKTQSENRAGKIVDQDQEPAAKTPELANNEGPATSLTNSDAPVALPISPASGNPLPELSMHSAALKVGRVILTTANPKVSEESLSQFARSQGAEVPGLVAVAPDETAGPIPQTAHTQNILHGLMGGQGQPPSSIAGHPAANISGQPMASMPGQPTASFPGQPTANGLGHPPIMPTSTEPGVLAAKPSIDPSAAQDSRLQFVQRPGVSGTGIASPGNALPAVSLPVDKSLSTPPTLQPMVDLNSTSTKGAGVERATLDAQFDPWTNAEFSVKKSPSDGQREAKSASITAHTALTNIDIDKPMLSVADGAPDGLPQQAQSQSLSAHAPMPTNAQSGLIHTPVSNTPVSLADALMSSDSGQMQSRLQPYQAWTQRFGEVLAQKLALAVKDGNWTVKLNLNPASLGPVGVDLQVRDGGIEGQIAASDPNVRQLLGDSIPKLRQSLEALMGEQGGVNIELGDGRDRGAKRENEQEIELSVDLLADEFVPSQQDMASGNILRDGLNVFV
jgi:hypothetical protein